MDRERETEKETLTEEQRQSNSLGITEFKATQTSTNVP